MTNTTVMIVDDDRLLRWSFGERLRTAGFDVLEAATRAEALDKGHEDVDVVLLDLKLPDGDGMDLLGELLEHNHDAPVIMITAFSTTDRAVEAMRRGAHDYLAKPFDLEDGLMHVERALETTRLRREMRAVRAGRSAPYSFDRIIGESPGIQQTRELLQRVAESRASTILITGESGTGKDLAAKCVHYNSERSAGPFMNITCSALSDTLIESELFGHESGAFTDARKQKKGLLEMASGGTVFLDEIGEMSASMQAKLLRFLEDKTFKRVGGSTDISPDVRIIAATHRDLLESVHAGRFREDLYYRLAVLTVHLPPLRERAGDIALLAKHQIDDFNREFKKIVEGVSEPALERLRHHDWPGNVRELRNVIERAVLLTRNVELGLEDLPSLLPLVGSQFRLPPEGIAFEDLEKDLVRQALELSGGSQTKAATLLGMNRDQIRYRITKFGLRARESDPGPPPVETGAAPARITPPRPVRRRPD